MASSSAVNIRMTRPRYGRSSDGDAAQLARAPALAADDVPESAARALTVPPPPLVGLARQEDLVGQALLGDLAVEVGLVEQLVVRAACRDSPVLEHDDLVGHRDRRQPVADDERRARVHQPAQRALDLGLGGGVDARCRVVEDQDARVLEQRARDRDALALPAGQRQPALADERVVAVGQARDERVDACLARRLLDLVVARLGPRVGDVVAQRRGEQERVVGDQADLAAQRSEVDVAHVGAVDDERCRRSGRTGAGSATPASTCPIRSCRRARRCGRPRRRGRLPRAPARRRPRRRTSTPRSSTRPPPSGSGGAPGGAVSSGSRSRISNTRAPEATARCAIPSAMPSIRTGEVSSST